VGLSFNLNKLILEDDRDLIKEENISSHDIAIIGINARIGEANNVDEFWNKICNGYDFIREYPLERKIDTEKYLEYCKDTKSTEQKNQYVQKAYMDDIDKFDCALFNITPTDANLMDPAQRLFLQSAWSAIEDAGYGGEKLTGTRTGIYVGYNNISSEDYLKFIEKLNPELIGLSLAGNIKSIIASRLSYILDFRGPAVIIDTACSSSLVAVHNACQALRTGECDTALAGGVKLNLVPNIISNDENIGTSSSTGRTKTFDNSADGTGGGEGVACIVLKPLYKAVEDSDNIYAVIKGSAINQDGTSVGITAPNSAAQEDVIVKAWEDAEIDPRTVSYIEAHGTATKLGDPVEINGIERAFKNYTNKKQFCAVGSIKTNVGHLDSAAGIAALIKVILALKNKQIPPNIHFNSPNRKINFIDSPVYVVDKLTQWDPDEDVRICGVSSFGLSGTNCHIVLEEAPKLIDKSNEFNEDVYLLTLSANRIEELKKLINAYKHTFEKNSEIDLANICYTASSGRGHYKYRLAMIIKSKEDYINRVYKILSKQIETDTDENIFYGEFKISDERKLDREPEEITEKEFKLLNNEAREIIKQVLNNITSDNEFQFKKLCEVYAKGADINWDSLYEGERHSKVSIPTYPFSESRHWIEPNNKNVNIKIKTNKTINHPLIDECLVNSMNVDVYSTLISVDRQWELREHALGNNNLLPGTTYIEIIREIGGKILETDALELRNIVFTAPLICNEGEHRIMHTVVEKKDDNLLFSIVSKNDNDKTWTKHVEGEVYKTKFIEVKKTDIDMLKTRCTNELIINDNTLDEAKVKIGSRWKNTKKIFIGEYELLVRMEFSKKYADELNSYYLYPSLLDGAVNAANAIAGSNFYLPLTYKKAKFYKRIPETFYSYLKRNTLSNNSDEIMSFNITLYSDDGSVLAEIDEYIIKKVRDLELKKYKNDLFYNVEYRSSSIDGISINKSNGITLVFIRPEQLYNKKVNSLIQSLKSEVLIVEIKNEYEKVDKNIFTISNSKNDFKRVLEEIGDKDVDKILFLASLEERKITDVKRLESTIEYSLKSLLNLTRAIIDSKYKNVVELILLTKNSMMVTGSEEAIHPHNEALLGMAKSIDYEYEKISCRGIDLDNYTSVENIMKEIKSTKEGYMSIYRNNERYIEELREIDINEINEEKIEIKNEGIYIVTGGLGGIGLEISKYLSNKNKINLALINRSEFPERDKWDDILSEGKDENINKKITELKRIEESGATVEIIRADISDYDETIIAFDKLREKYGKINGVIHSAGVAGKGFIINKEWDQFNEVLKPKVYGTWIIDDVTSKDNLDFFILFSSFATVFGSRGQSDYIAANSYLDAFAYFRKNKGKRTMVVNWSGWNETGMAVDNNINQNEGIFKTMNNSEAVKTFDDVFDKTAERIMIGEINNVIFAENKDYFNLKLSPKITNKISNFESKQIDKDNYVEVIIKGKDFKCLTSTEIKLAKIWAEVIGLDEINIYDKFFEIGGDSLLATHLQKELNKVYPDVMDITDVFIYSSILEMAEFIDSKINALKITDEINDDKELELLFSRLSSGEITVDDAEKLIKN